MALNSPLHPVLVRLAFLIELPLCRTVAAPTPVLNTDDHPLIIQTFTILTLLPLGPRLLLLSTVGILVARQKLLVDNGVHLVLIGRDCLDAEVVRAEGVVVVVVGLRLLKGVELRVGGGEAGVVAEVGEAETLGSALAGEVILWVGGVQQAVQA